MIDIVLLYQIVLGVSSLVLIFLAIVLMVKAIRFVESCRVVSQRCETATNVRGIYDWIKTFRKATQ